MATLLYDRLYGEIRPIPRRSGCGMPADQWSKIDFAGRRFRCYYTPGSCATPVRLYQDERTGGVFTGDTFGISYRDF
jgi:hypothetical protein